MDYSKYRDTVSDYYNDLADARSAYDSEWNKDYTQWADQLSYWQQKAAQEQAYWQSQQKAAGGRGGSGGGSGGGSAGSSGTGSGKGYIDNTYNSGGAGGATAQTYNQLKRGMTEWIMAGQPEKAYDLFLSMAGQLNLSNSTGKKQYNELASILNKAGFGIPLE